jgi:hypothetical protein
MRRRRILDFFRLWDEFRGVCLFVVAVVISCRNFSNRTHVDGGRNAAPTWTPSQLALDCLEVS